jgi:hypothetical protein
MISINLLQQMELEFELFIPDSVQHLCVIAKLLHDINKRRKFVGISDFYNEGISNSVRPVESINSFY